MSKFSPFFYHEVQQRLWADRLTKRFQVVAAGRRSGKTELSKRRICESAIIPPHSSANYFAGAPTVAQSKRIFWRDLTSFLEPVTVATNKTDLTITTMTGATVHVVGLDKPERIEGTPWDGGVITEIASVKESAWGENIYPALDTIGRPGWCVLEGVPEGRNWFYSLFKDIQSGRRGDMWGAYHWKSSEVLPAEMIEQARMNLDELTFKQEYEAEFVIFAGACYYNFSEENICSQPFDENRDVHLCFDFNTSPGIAIIIQQFDAADVVVDEIHIPRNSNTEMICDRLVTMFHDYDRTLYLYGDATGEASRSSGVMGSDWHIIDTKLTQGCPKAKIQRRIPRANPRERARVNALNSRLKSASGVRRLYVDASCTNTIKDFEGVQLDKSGSIDKKDATLSHITDAIGYFAHRLYPIGGLDLKSLLGNQKIVVGPKKTY